MADASTEQVTNLVLAWSNGNEKALDSLIPLVYDELHRIAKRHMDREGPGHTVQTTALVHEACLWRIVICPVTCLPARRQAPNVHPCNMLQGRLVYHSF